MTSALSTITSTKVPEPSIGHAGISQKIVDQTVEALVQVVAQPYLKLVAETAKKLQENPDLYKDRGQPFTYFKIGKINIPRANIDCVQTKEERYLAEFGFETTELTEETPFYSLLKPLSERVASLGYFCDLIDLRFEKGSFQCDGDYWHRDFYKTAVTICFGNVEKWCTRVYNEKHDTEKITAYRLKTDELIKEKVESLSEKSHFGYFYDAQNLHRAPLITDLKDQPIKEKDYRLFLRFYKMRNE